MVSLLLWAGHGIEIGAYWALSQLLQRVGWHTAPTVALALAFAGSWRIGFILLTFRLARVAPRPAWALAEARAFIAATMLMMLAPLMPKRTPGRTDRVPVLLVHGWHCNSGIWWPLRRVLARSRAGDVHTIDLPLWRSLGVQVDALGRKIDEVLASRGVDRIAIVGHSMGGIIARAYLASDAARDRIARLITIASPHHGTVLSHRAIDPAGRELRPDSPQLAALPPLDGRIAVTALYSEIDNFVAPQTSALLEGAENLSCGQVGHLELLFTPAVLEAVAVRLEHTR